jgi:lipopolysaccharide heptosyltransferase I
MKILVVKTSSLGDIIHTLPAVRDAANRISDLTIDWVVEEAFAEIPGWHHNVNCVIPVAWRRWRKDWHAFRSQFNTFRRALRKKRYDKIIDAQGLFKSAVIARLARGERIGLSFSSLTEPLARIFYNNVVKVNLSGLAVDRMRSIFAQSLGYTYESLPLDYGLKPFQVPENLKMPYVFFAHGTTWPSKQWPFEHWTSLAQKLQRHKHFVYITWYTNEEKKLAVYLADKCPNVVVLPRQSLTAIAAVISHSKALVGVDTGLSHLAAACHIPSVTLYGPTNPLRTGTVGDRQVHLQPNFDCLKCDQAVCRYHDKTYVQAQCLTMCDSDLVFNRLIKFLAC